MIRPKAYSGRTSKEIARRLRNDYEYFSPRCLRIITKDAEIKPLRFNAAQRHIHEQLELQKKRTGWVRALILKGRQQGASTYITGRHYHAIAMKRQRRSFILTHEQPATDNLYGMVRRYHQNMPDQLQPTTGQDSAKSLYMSNNDSRISIATAGTKATGRSATAQYFHGSEVGFWPNAKTHMAGIGQVVPDVPGTEIILESTANGIGNMFHTMWTDAVRGVGDYIAIFVPWFWQPEYRRKPPKGFVLDDAEAEYKEAYGLDMEQMAWRRYKIANLGGDIDLFNQEYPATPEMAFMIAATKSLISPMVVQAARSTGPIHPYGPLIMGVDPAEYGPDSSSIIFRQGRLAWGLERFQRKGPMELAGIIATLIEKHKPNAVCIDSTGMGIGVCDALEEQGYAIHKIKFGARAFDNRYADRRTEIWSLMGNWFKDDPVHIPQDEVLASDLTGLTYTYNSARQLVLESKESAAKRGIPSPDTADALACTFGVSVSMDVAPDGGPAWKKRLRAAKRRRGSAQAA